MVCGVAGLWAGGQEEAGPPQTRTLVEGEAYISPQTSPGVQDSLEIPIEVAAVGSRRVIAEYRLTILNSDDRVVWLEESVDESPEPGFFARLFTNLGFRTPDTTVEIPESTSWDGTYKINGPDDHPDDGKPVPEGVYTYVLEAVDSEGNSSETEPQMVVVDNTPPEATVNVQYEIFSPNGDGDRDTVRVNQQSSQEDLWVGTVLNEGATEVFAVEWEGQVPSLIVWDGRDPDGENLPDGTYQYTLTSTDRAGNTFTLTDPEVTIDTAERPLRLVLETQAFSPDGDGVQDTTEISFADAVMDGLVSSTVRVRNESGSTVRSWDSVDLESFLVFDGLDSQGDRLPEGDYQISARARYDNGTVVEPEPVLVTLDVTPPSATVRTSYEIFSPEGDGLKDTVTISQDAEDGVQWQGIVRDGAGELAASVDWGKSVTEEVVWDGTGPEGEPVPDGTYQYQLVGIDPAGNDGTSNTISVTVDTRETTASISAAHEYFSPNGDNERDILDFQTDLSLSTGIEEYRLTIVSDDGNAVRTFSGTGTLPTRAEWNGTTDRGSQAPEGGYQAELFLEYRKGNRVTATTDEFYIDRTVPEVQIEIGEPYFSPNGDGVQDTSAARASVTPSENLVSSVLSLEDSRGRVILTRDGFTSGAIEWDGRTPDGRLVDDGRYVLRLESEHRNGTTVNGEAQVVVDTQAPEISVELQETALVLTDASQQESITIRQSSSREDLWTGEIYDADTGEVVYTETWEGGVESLQWQGRTTRNTIVADGRYRYRVSSTDPAGNRTMVQTQEIAVTTASRIRLGFDGLGVSPNGDGAFDTIDLVVESDQTIELSEWTIEIRSASGVVRRITGDSMSTPSRITWDGMADDGSVAPEGEYDASIRAAFRTGSMGARTDVAALVDLTGPEANLSLSGQPFSPDEDGHNDELELQFDAADPAGVDRWQLRVVDDGELWRRFTGSTVPANQTWSGSTTGSRVFESASMLTVEYTVVDGLANESSGQRDLQIGVMVDMVDGRRQIRVPNVVFEGYTTNYTTWDEEIAEQNMESIDRVAQILQTFPSYRLELDGHAVSVLYYDEALSEREHREVLIPLSRDRVEIIREALVDEGVSEGRIEINWFGGSDPIVPFSNLEDRWINRRVEFYIVR
jgi:flagellar hook assembly protein FlgD/outer membrane protein OmpA-like peptidoglycan-associated protein